MDDLLLSLHHVGIAVTELAAARDLYSQTLGLTPGLHRLLPLRGVEVQFFDMPGAKIELLAPLGTDSPIQRFLDRRGPGLHHVCYSVADITAALKALTGKGMVALDPEPRPGAEDRPVVFLHPKSAGGVLIELQEL